MNNQSIYNNYYTKGCLSGMVGIIISHPVDSIKTHIQTNSTQHINYSLKNLYRGIMSPLIGVGLEKALVFGTYNYCINSNCINNNHINSNYKIPISGAISGLVASLIVSPYERIKIMHQTSQPINIKSLQLFKGMGTTFTREVPGFAIYFSTYEMLKNKFYKDKSITIPASFLFGGMSGTMAWIFIYPQDRIKTIIQSNTGNINIVELIKNTYRVGGLKQFYKGFSFAVARAILLHSGTFCMMEILNKEL